MSPGIKPFASSGSAYQQEEERYFRRNDPWGKRRATWSSARSTDGEGGENSRRRGRDRIRVLGCPSKAGNAEALRIRQDVIRPGFVGSGLFLRRRPDPTPEGDARCHEPSTKRRP